MILIKKIDVKNYLASPKRNGFRRHRPAGSLDVAGLSGDTSRRAGSNASRSEEPFSQPFLHGTETPQTKAQPDCGQRVTPSKSKSVRR